MRASVTLTATLLSILCALRDGPAEARRPPAPSAAAAPDKGVALGLFSEDAGFSYRSLLDEIAALGATHVELVVAWYLDDVRAAAVHDHPRYTAPDEALVRAIADARAAGLRVVVAPILRLERQQNPDEWRGTLRPADRPALFRSYTDRLVRLARLCQRAGVTALSIGSELSSLDGAADHAAWAAVVKAVRGAGTFRGRLLYSGNWDHFEQVGIYDLVDGAGLSAYFKLSEAPTESVDELTRSWLAVRQRLAALSSRIGRPIVLTEVGYLSQHGATAWPWDEGAEKPVDLADQRRAYEAFAAAWRDAPPSLLGGTYFWNWYGFGGPHSRGYTPRGKPAADVLRAFYTRR